MDSLDDIDSLDDDGEIRDDETKCCGVLRIIIDVVDIVLVVIGVAVVLREKAATSLLFPEVAKAHARER